MMMGSGVTFRHTNLDRVRRFDAYMGSGVTSGTLVGIGYHVLISMDNLDRSWMYPGLQLNAAMLASLGAHSPQEAMEPLNHPSSSKNNQGGEDNQEDDESSSDEALDIFDRKL
uniref:'chromo' domain containing protein n=1 Tax=Solanum tuberosum TaxID=4113 RepID=M1DX12_SOLTU